MQINCHPLFLMVGVTYASLMVFILTSLSGLAVVSRGEEFNHHPLCANDTCKLDVTRDVEDI